MSTILLMQNLRNCLLQSGHFTKEQIDLVESRSTTRTLKPGEYFSEAGKTAAEIAFVLSGILRVCYYTNTGNEITLYFIDENNFAVDLGSYNHQITSSLYFQAIPTTELLVISKPGTEKGSPEDFGWNKIVTQITAMAAVHMAILVSPIQAEEAGVRYKNFLKSHPQIIGRIPLGYLASYLGITQQSLSRIRKQLTKKGPFPYEK
ncbi:MAG TPA: Crp/Fnr family transcriptional regulator [Puia sp.]|nr:Crp/Fnr family transcriptional regulator [Puia sp.]